MGRQHQKDDAVTVVLAAPVQVNRFISHSGRHATSAGGPLDSLGVSEFGGGIGEPRQHLFVQIPAEYPFKAALAGRGAHLEGGLMTGPDHTEHLGIRTGEMLD